MENINFAKLNKNSYAPESRRIIEGWQERALTLAQQENFKNHPTTVALAKEAQSCIDAIESRLKDEEDMELPERKALFKEKKVHQFYLQLFTWDPSPEIETLSKEVNEEIFNN